jgi:hypothetical protein
MLLNAQPPCHLTYCLNIHPGETWPENLAAIRDHALAVRRLVAPEQPFGLGLRLSRRAAETLAQPDPLAAFHHFLDDHRLYVFTVNGFPYGTFHGARVKTDVYRPDWRTAERRDYTILLADILAALLPPDGEGSISTVPGSYRAWIKSAADEAAIAGNLADVVLHLADLRRRTGKLIHLGLEPEPDCWLETTQDALDAFAGPLREHGRPRIMRQEGCGRDAAEALLRDHLGICFDTCHLAVQFEPLDQSLRRLGDAGIRVSKVQLSAALTAAPTTAARLRLQPFLDPVYLHQVKLGAGGVRAAAFPDLPDALAADASAGDSWRIHFHVPLYFAGDGTLGTTAEFLDAAFFRETARQRISHLEIETYTFHVLPESLRAPDVSASIAREYAWVMPRAQAAWRPE